MKGFRPYRDNVLVLLDVHNPDHPDHPRNRKTAGGIYIPETSAPTDGFGSVWGTVIASGPGNFAEWDPRVFIPNEVKPGDRVCITGERHNKRADLVGDVFFVDGVEHRIVRAHDLGAREAAE